MSTYFVIRGHYHSARVSTRLALGKYAEHLKVNVHENFYANTNRETETRTHAHKNAHARAKITIGRARRSSGAIADGKKLFITISLILKIKKNSCMIRSTMRQTNHMCLYPRLFKNQKYLPNKKNNGIVPTMKDKRTEYVPIGCGNCIECRKQKARAWQIRLHEQIKETPNAIFVTFSFAPKELNKLVNETKNKLCNATATIAVRRFLERYRKKYKHSVKHWFVTELGHENTKRLHLHGIIFYEHEKPTNEELEKIWKYGNIFIGDYCSARTINYIVKYITKVDTENKTYKSIVLCSAGLGKKYINEFTKDRHKYRPTETKEYYMLPNGTKINMPIYYRNKLYNEEEREQLWIEKIDKHERYVLGIKIEKQDTEKGLEQYGKVLEQAQKINTEMGYGTDKQEWKKQDYNITNKMLNIGKL